MRTRPHRPQVLRLALGAVFAVLGVGSMALPGSSHTVVAQGTPAVQTRNVGMLGTVLTGSNGMTLYVFDRDMPGVSNCNDQCAMIWPPLVLDAGTPAAPPGVGGALSVLMRSDGRRQVAYNTRPLYFYMPDTQPGDTRGEGVGGVWHVASALLTAAGQPGASAMPRTGTGLTADAQHPVRWAGYGIVLAVVVLGGIAVYARRRATVGG